MNIEEFKNKFFELEKNYNLFDYKIEKEIYWWDIIRYDVYYELMYTLEFRKRNREITDSFQKNYRKKINKLFYLILDIVKFFLKKKKKFLFYKCTRNIDKNGKKIDIIADDFLNIVYKDSFVIESNPISYKEKKYKNSLLKIKKKLKKERCFKLDIDLEKIFFKEFGIKTDINGKIQSILNNYFIEYKHYVWLLKKINPKIIFVVQNGIQKGLFSAANYLNIPVVELQHGQVNNYHLAYSYPVDIDYSNIKTLPKYFFTFGKFWNNINYPVKKKIDMGNNFYSLQNIEKTGDKIAIVFADIYTSDLLPLTINLLKKDIKRNYIVKLHPNQKNQIQIIKNELKAFKNVEIIYNEKSMQEVLDESFAIIQIQSTTIYEALQKNKIVFLYKKQDYITHHDVFYSKNVYLVNNENDILEGLSKNKSLEEDICFFEKFNKEKFLKFIKDELKEDLL